MIGFNFAQPFLIVSAIGNLRRPEASKNDGYGLIGAAFFIYSGIAVRIDPLFARPFELTNGDFNRAL
tara:strand:+ start:1093 stop:1293 length:201 start_codon:yes stop_codon:yes gene_type:complete